MKLVADSNAKLLLERRSTRVKNMAPLLDDILDVAWMESTPWRLWFVTSTSNT
jgi:hypothetical protein